MKDFVIPYMVAEYNEWRTGIDIYNHDDKPAKIKVTVFKQSGHQANSKEYTIDKWAGLTLGPDDLKKNLKSTEAHGRGRIIIQGPDCLMITPLKMIIKDGQAVGFGVLPVFESTILKK